MTSERSTRRQKYAVSSAINGAIDDMGEECRSISIRGDAALTGDPECSRQAFRAIFSAIGEEDARISVTSDPSRVFVAISSASSNGGANDRLGIARWLIELGGGSLDVSSTESRTCVLVSLPRCEVTHSLQPDRAPRIGGPVLVIDDDDASREVTTLILARVGIETMCAGTADQGIARARERGVSAIILEIATSGFEGWNVIRALQSDSATRDIPIVVLTIQEDPANAMRLGASAFLRKPCSEVELISALRRVGACPGTLVLAVDDDSAALRQYERTLGASGFRVLRASPARALMALETAKPDLVIATHAARSLEEKAKSMHIPLVAIARAPLTDEERAKAIAGTDALLEQRDIARPSFPVKLETAVRATMPTMVPRRRVRDDRPSISP